MTILCNNVATMQCALRKPIILSINNSCLCRQSDCKFFNSRSALGYAKTEYVWSSLANTKTTFGIQHSIFLLIRNWVILLAKSNNSVTHLQYWIRFLRKEGKYIFRCPIWIQKSHSCKYMIHVCSNPSVSKRSTM